MAKLIERLRDLPAVVWVQIFFGTLAFGLLLGGMLAPPMGEADGSVLTSGGILAGYMLIITFTYAVATGKRATFKHGTTEATIGDDE